MPFRHGKGNESNGSLGDHYLWQECAFSGAVKLTKVTVADAAVQWPENGATRGQRIAISAT